MYWASGFSEAPDVVRLAVQSWQDLNPELELVLLDDTNLSSWLGDSQRMAAWSTLDIQKRSDLLRMLLLTEHGGFWADSTVVCTKPLRQWVDFRPSTGVIFLRAPARRNRFIQTFFLGGLPGSAFLARWLNETESLLTSGVRPMTNATMKRWRRRWPLLWSNQLSTSIWSSRTITRRTGYPYLVPHYLANRLILTSPRMLAAYLKTPIYVAGEALHFQSEEEAFQLFQENFRTRNLPLWKLTWRTELRPDYWEDVIVEVRDYLAGQTG